MLLTATGYVLLGLAVLPFIYYILALYSSWRLFGQESSGRRADFTPPVSILKPVRGIDPDAYENFASFCRQDYPDYEILFCAGADDEQAINAIEQLKRDFPERRIRLLFGSRRRAVNDKVAKLARLVAEAQHEYLAISDSDVRVAPDYLRSVMAPLADAKVGGLTCFYGSIQDHTFADRLQTVGMFSDFYAGIIVARQLDGVKFALGQTIVTKRALIAGFGGYQRLENRPGDDLLVGRLIAEQGYEVKLLPYTVGTVSDYRSIGELLQKRLRWIVVMRHMRPWGHLGLLMTYGLPWSIAAVAIHPTLSVALGYLGAYALLRLAMTWSIGVRGLRRSGLLKEIGLIPVWDAVACLLWLASFLRNSVRWRGGEYYIRDGMLVPATSPSVSD
ncbi:MAG TPA: glycosyltransferase [Bryobacteraceae bacterium]|jgi:ceramide glucosyltransferase|nr:glycosyltransferase [Bryobacteraceae bacterium]